MNANGAHDNELLEKIEKLLKTRQSVGHDLLDDLVATVPQASAAFQERLEAQLLDQLKAQQAAERSEPAVDTLIVEIPAKIAVPRTKPARRANPALTLAAALLVLIAAGMAICQ